MFLTHARLGPYVAPHVELPCTCLYGRRGNIVLMKPLCPFHGYFSLSFLRSIIHSFARSGMVRRREEYLRDGVGVLVAGDGEDEQLTAEELAAIDEALTAEREALLAPPPARPRRRKFRVRTRFFSNGQQPPGQ